MKINNVELDVINDFMKGHGSVFVYHPSDWNDIMRIVEKVEEFAIVAYVDIGSYEVIVERSSENEDLKYDFDQICVGEYNTKLENTFYACFQFIELMNKNNKEK